MSEWDVDPEYPEKIVCFLDILGYRNIVVNEPQSALSMIKTINGHMSHVLSVLSKNYGKHLSTQLFSDCMCISCDYTLENLFYILYELASIQLLFSADGIFLRGAISVGNHFENERMIFSRGLINAYELEQTALFPRIVVDTQLIQQIMSDEKAYLSATPRVRSKDFVVQSPDGLFSVDYLHAMHLEGMDWRHVLRLHKRAIEVAIGKNLHDNRVIEKLRWLADYHNLKFDEVFGLNMREIAESDTLFSEIHLEVDTLFRQFKKM